MSRCGGGGDKMQAKVGEVTKGYREREWAGAGKEQGAGKEEDVIWEETKQAGEGEIAKEGIEQLGSKRAGVGAHKRVIEQLLWGWVLGLHDQSKSTYAHTLEGLAALPTCERKAKHMVLCCQTAAAASAAFGATYCNCV